MRVPVMRGVIERRLLVNYRVDPGVVARMLPAPFEPQIVNGFAVAGICLIRLGHMRPRAVPRRLGLASENAAHRFAVQWEQDGALLTGVYIPRRDSASAVNAAVPARSVTFDSVFVMRNIQVEWHGLGSLPCNAPVGSPLLGAAASAAGAA